MTSGRSALIALPTPVISPPPPIAQMTVAHLGQILEDLEPHRAVAGDEIVIVERVDEGAVEPFERMRFGGDPGLLVGHRHDRRAERAHSVELGLRRGLDRDDGARNPELPRRISDALPRIARADRPHALARAPHRTGAPRHCVAPRIL